MIKIFLTYFISSVIPPLGLVIMGFIYASEDCRQCSILIPVASFLMFMTLLVLNSVQFLVFIPIKDKQLENALLFVYAFFTPIVFAFFMFYNYYKMGDTNTDFQMSLPSIILNFILCFYTWKVFRAYKKEKNSGVEKS